MNNTLAPEVFDRLQEAMATDPKGLVELYRDYLTDGFRILQELRQATERQDCEQLRTAAHYLKGSSQVLGARAVAQQCASIEECAKAAKLAGVDRLVASTAAALDAAQGELARRLGEAVIPDFKPTAGAV